jgi:copper(I)-binding protein
MKRLSVLGIWITLLWSGALWADGMNGTGVEAHEAWIRATPPNARMGAAYMHLMNYEPTADALVKASSSLAEAVELHHVTNQDGVMKMYPVPEIEIPGGGMAELKPGGFHVMFIGLKQQLKPGDAYPITLHFRNAPEVTVSVPVLENPMSMNHDAMHRMHHGGSDD